MAPLGASIAIPKDVPEDQVRYSLRLFKGLIFISLLTSVRPLSAAAVSTALDAHFSPTCENFRNLARGMFNLAIEQNGNSPHMGQLNLAQLRDSIEHIDWQEQKIGLLNEAGQGRSTAKFNLDRRQVVCSREDVEASPLETVHIIAAHEVLGANKIIDDRYDGSVAITIKSMPRSNLRNPLVLPPGAFELMDEHLKKLKVREKNPEYFDKFKGGTTAGGGGDNTGVFFKLMTLLYLEKLIELYPRIPKLAQRHHLKHTSLELFRRVLLSFFEKESDPSVQRVTRTLMTFQEKSDAENNEVRLLPNESILRIPPKLFSKNLEAIRRGEVTLEFFDLLLQAISLVDQATDEDFPQ